MDTPLAFTWSWPGIDPATIDPTTVTVSRDPCGRWYVAFAVDVPEPGPLPVTGRVVGVDLGVKDFAVTSGGQRIPNPRHLERRARNLARYQRQMARCQQGRSAGRAGRKLRVSAPVRALSSSGVPVAITVPWSTTAIWSARMPASSRYWVVRSTVTPVAARPRTTSHVSLRLRGSSPVVGSSR
jgi:hypothetical protein